MKTIEFKTNINCGGCVSKVTEPLNTIVGQENWKVNTDNPDKILTVTAQNITADTIVTAIKKLGFSIEEITN